MIATYSFTATGHGNAHHSLVSAVSYDYSGQICSFTPTETASLSTCSSLLDLLLHPGLAAWLPGRASQVTAETSLPPGGRSHGLSSIPWAEGWNWASWHFPGWKDLLILAAGQITQKNLGFLYHVLMELMNKD